MSRSQVTSTYTMQLASILVLGFFIVSPSTAFQTIPGIYISGSSLQGRLHYYRTSEQRLTHISNALPHRARVLESRINLHKPKMSATSAPVDEIMPSLELLAKACRAAKEAVEKSTGEGTESSGSGRYEWGTWCDEKLFADVRDAVEAVGLKGSPELWPALWKVVGGEKNAAKMLIAKGKDWYCYLHLFMNSKDYTGQETFKAQHPTGMNTCINLDFDIHMCAQTKTVCVHTHILYILTDL
jgi:hypothetical protein